MKLSIIIVNYNVKFYLEQCLNSIQKSVKDHQVEVIVTDNASSDGSIEYLKPKFPHVKFIANKENAGFARANNQAIKTSSGEYVMLLNPDTIIGENTITDCIRFMDDTPGAGATGVRMLKSNGMFALESRRGIPTPFTSFCKMTGLCNHFPKSRFFGKYYMQYLDSSKINEIEIISGAFMFIRRTTLEKSGLLDEDFFMYGEDIDLSYRILKTGAKNYYLPTEIIHYKGESTEKSSYKYVYVFYQAMLIFFRKHFHHYSLFISIPIKCAIYFKAVCTYINQNIRKINRHNRNSLLGRNRHMLVLCAEDKIAAIQSILNGNNIKSTIIPVDDDIRANGHTKHTSANYDYVLYDSDIFKYNDIFRFLSVSSNWQSKPKLATYLSQRIITEDEVFS